jgi:hypothetical protein
MCEDLCKTALRSNLSAVQYVPLKYKTERFFIDLLEEGRQTESDDWE